MTMREPGEVGPAPRPGALRRIWTSGLAVHLLVLALVLIGVGLATAPDGSFVADDGSYELQLRALDEGAWEWHAGSTGGGAANYPIANADRTETGWAPYAKHPAWPWLASQIGKATGVGLAYVVLGLLSVLALAAVAWVLSATHEPRWSRWAFCLAGTAPVAITAAVPWAHAAGAAAAGLAVLGAIRVVARPGSLAAIAGLGFGVAGAVLMRTEGLLLAGAVAVALVVGGRQAGRSWAWSAGAGGLTVITALAVVRAEGAWIRSITGGGTTTFEARGAAGEAPGFIDARLDGAVRSLVDGGRPSTTILLVLVVLAAAVAAALTAAGRSRMVGVWQMAAGASIVMLALRVATLSNYPVSGLLAAWPVVVAGIAGGLAVAWTRVRMEVTVVAVYGTAILATQYADGGSGSWGGRFFALATVPVVVVACVGVERLLAVAPDPGDAILPVRRFLVALVAIPFLLGVAVVYEVQSSNAALYRWVETNVDGLGITPAVELPRMMWRQDVRWLVVDDGDEGEDLAAVLDSLLQEDQRRASLVVLDRDLDLAAAALADEPRWSEVSRSQRDGLTVVVLER